MEQQKLLGDVEVVFGAVRVSIRLGRHIAVELTAYCICDHKKKERDCLLQEHRLQLACMKWVAFSIGCVDL